MASIKKQPSHRANLSRNGFDMSKRILFTSSVGHLLPVYYDFLNPGDKVRCNENVFTRTKPLNTSAFVRVTEHVEWFFVPIQHLDSYFGNAFYGISDLGSSALVVPSGSSTYQRAMPQKMYTCTLENISDSIAQTFEDYNSSNYGNASVNTADTGYFDIFSIPLAANAIRLLSLLGYSENSFKMGANTGTPVQTSWLKDLKVTMNLFLAYQKIFYDFYRLTDFTPNNVSIYNIDSRMRSGQSGLERLEAGSTNPMQIHYRPWKKDFFTNVKPSPLFSIGQSVSGYGSSYVSSVPSTDNSLDSAVLSNYGINPSLDWSNGGYNDVAAQSGSYVGRNGSATNGGTQNSVNVPIGALEYSVNNNTVASIRTAFAWEKLLSITNRTSAHYDAQTLAHFGYRVPQGVSGEVYYLGGHSNVLQIGEVTATATSSGDAGSSVLGQISGKGFSVSSGKQKTIKFTAPCHGYLMAIYSAVPEADYGAFGVDRLNTYTSINDYYHPEFDRLGMQPLYYYQSYLTTDLTNPTTHANPLSRIIGWQYRYSELKSKYDTVHGSFLHSDRDWVSLRNVTDYARFNANTIYKDVSSSFYIDPRYLNSIFVPQFGNRGASGDLFVITSAEGDTSPVFANDPFLHSIDFRVYKTSCMSTYGLPNL